MKCQELHPLKVYLFTLIYHDAKYGLRIFSSFLQKTLKQHYCPYLLASGNKLEEDVGDIVSIQTQTSPYFQLREKFKCIEHIA